MANTNKIRYFNRELSWLEFNQRVLEEAKNPQNPILERLKFLAITASNLDEFFMVRVGGLYMARKAGRRKKDPAGLTPLMQLREIGKRSRAMLDDLHSCFTKVVSPALDNGGIKHVDIHALTTIQELFLFELFKEEIFPVITPISVGQKEKLPHLPNLALQLLVQLHKNNPADRKDRYAVISLDRTGSRIIHLPAESGFAYVLQEEVVKKYAGNWFPSYVVKECAVFRVTRNADFAVQENEAPDLLSGMEDVLEERKTGSCIRLEVESSISKKLQNVLCSKIPAEPENVYPIQGVLNLKDFMPMAFVEGFDELKAEAWPAQPSADIIPNEPMFGQIAKQDRLLYHPYESFDPVIRFIEEASMDPETLAIKMVLYRTSSESTIVQALKRAAENGVNVTVLMELKARFDEAQNISWALDLEQCGVQVIHGVKGYKTHAKICLVVRREPTGIVRYCHFGTGNYNESTAKLYGDISYLTCSSELGTDASAFFNALCGYAQPQDFNLISMAPIGMRDSLIELIEFETVRARNGKKAFISVKVNSLVDVALIDKLDSAAKAGVEVHLNVRGICCLKPHRNMLVKSIVDRYLEHARIFHFHHGGKPRVFISSADWMPRNLDKRLELMIPIEDESCRNRLIDFLRIHMADNVKSWLLKPTGSYVSIKAEEGHETRSQEMLYTAACKAVEASAKKRRTQFEPHRSER